jgi:hypothetical protein
MRDITASVFDDMTLEIVDAKLRVPVSSWQQERMANICQENIDEQIRNLANFDDNQFALTARGAGVTPHTNDGEMFRITHLMRVRSLYQIGQQTPDIVLPSLRKAFSDGIQAFPEAYKMQQERWREARGRGLYQTEPNDYDKVTLQMTVATYLLAELGDHDSLRDIVNGYRLQRSWLDPDSFYAVEQTPVPLGISIYAIHRLIETYPSTKMSDNAQRAHDTYIAWANQHVPPVRMARVTTSSAQYDESDPAIQILDPQRLVLRDQPSMEMPYYPTVQGFDARFGSEYLDNWFESIEEFVASLP